MRRSVMLALAFGLACSAADAQAPKPPTPTAFPAPGVYTNTTSVTLRDADPGAEIRYTWDGSTPTKTSPLFDPKSVLFIAGLYDGDKGQKAGYTLRAVAVKDGAISDPATFLYSVERRDRTAYMSEEIAPGVRMIRDSDNDKMFLVRGASSWALIDTGMGRGALAEYVAQYTMGAPLKVIATHSHGDHIGQFDQFITKGPVYIGAPDREATATLLRNRGVDPKLIETNLKTLADGDRIDLGDRALRIFVVPGHTPGSLAILDPSNGDLFTGDTFGSNSSLPPDLLWMQGYANSLDVYYANVVAFRERVKGNRITRINTGHNDRPVSGTAYLDNLEKALQRAMDEGESALEPSVRPAGLAQVVVGDRFTDPNWVGVNVNRKTFLPAPPAQIARLVSLRLTGATLSRPFDPGVFEYAATLAPGQSAITIAPRPLSTKAGALFVDGRKVAPGKVVRIAASRPREVSIEVVAPDGKAKQNYRLNLTRP